MKLQISEFETGNLVYFTIDDALERTKAGIIVNVSKKTITIRWSTNGEEVIVSTSTARKMIMRGSMTIHNT